MASRFLSPPDPYSRAWRSAPGSGVQRITLCRAGCVLALALFLFVLDLHAQTATVIGTITHHNGTAAANVLVNVGGRYRYTDVGGRYRLAGVPLGVQRMIIRRGKTILWQGNVQVTGTTAIINQVIP